VTRAPVTIDFRSEINSPVEALLHEIRDEIRGLRADLGKAITDRLSVSSLSRADRGRLATLLPAIGGVFGSEEFHSADICEHDAAALRLVCAGLTARQLGRLLRRAAGTPIGGYLVERHGVEAGAVRWRVVHVPEFLGNDKVSVPHATSRGRV
jgi:hypothetical protein